MIRLLIALALPVGAQTPATHWGMSAAQVRAIESGKGVKVESGIQFESGDTRRLYVFDRDKLVRVRFTSAAQHADENEFIRDFQAQEAKLGKQYGQPSEDRALWTDDATQLEPKSYLDQDRATATGILPSDQGAGLAVSLGHLKMMTERIQNRTRILHILAGSNGHISHQVEFRNLD